jgi:hypothetical protein
VSEFREIRLRLNLHRQRDRWLAESLDAAAETLGVPVASLLRRALVHYFRDREGVDETPPQRHAVGRRGAVNAVVSADEMPGARTRGREADPWVEDDTDDMAGTLASLGTPPELPDASD